jgi:CubicO group peptidase (beta-lactamase class C family)
MATQVKDADAQPTVEVQGTCDDRFAAVRELFAALLNDGVEIGAAFAIYLDGEPIVDLWGGYADEARTRPWGRDTIVNTFSTTKTMTALSMLVLADRGEVDLDAPVAKYWPEFAAAGKGRVLVRHFLGHTAGLPGWTEPVTLADILDREKATSLLARQASWWEPGTAAGYHSITMGPLLGEVIRRVTGKTLTSFFADEVAGPLGGDYHIGVPAALDGRVSNMIRSAPNRPRTDPDSIMDRVFFNPYATPEDSGTIAWRRGELGGSNGHGNARSVCAVQSVLSCGGEARGVRLLSRAGCERVLETQTDGMDQVLGFPMRWGLGYALVSPGLNTLFNNQLTGRRIAFWGGSGGSIAFNDLDARLTIGYVMNRHVEHGGLDVRGSALVVATYDAMTAAGLMRGTR